jgi:hypothetical protein
MEAETKVYIGRGHEDTVSVIVGVGQRTGVCHASGMLGVRAYAMGRVYTLLFQVVWSANVSTTIVLAGPFVQVHSLSCCESSLSLDPFSSPKAAGRAAALCQQVGECSRQYKRRPLPSRRACVGQPGKRHAWRAKFSDPASRCR